MVMSLRESSRPPFERRQFGGTERQSKPFDEDVPISRSDLKKEHRSCQKTVWLILFVKCLSRKFGSVLCALPARMFKTFAYVPGSSDWMGSWTLFFWAF